MSGGKEGGAHVAKGLCAPVLGLWNLQQQPLGPRWPFPAALPCAAWGGALSLEVFLPKFCMSLTVLRFLWAWS